MALFSIELSPRLMAYGSCFVPSRLFLSPLTCSNIWIKYFNVVFQLISVQNIQFKRQQKFKKLVKSNNKLSVHTDFTMGLIFTRKVSSEISSRNSHICSVDNKTWWWYLERQEEMNLWCVIVFANEFTIDMKRAEAELNIYAWLLCWLIPPASLFILTDRLYAKLS